MEIYTTEEQILCLDPMQKKRKWLSHGCLSHEGRYDALRVAMDTSLFKAALSNKKVKHVDPILANPQAAKEEAGLAV